MTKMTADEKQEIARRYVAMARRHGLTEEQPKGNWLDKRRQRVGCTLCNGVVTIYHEYYVEESYEDDDLSMGGYQLAACPGLTRVCARWAEPDFGRISDLTADAMRRCLAHSRKENER